MIGDYLRGMKVKKQYGGKLEKCAFVLLCSVFILCGCSTATQDQIQTVAAYQIQATVFSAEMEGTSTALAATAESVQATITEMYGPTDTPTQTMTPSISPTPSSSPTRTPVPLPNHKVVVVTADRSPLRYAKKENKAGKPVMVIYESGGKRYIFEQGDKVKVYPWTVIADGSDVYYRVLPGQIDMYGRGIPSSPPLYILAKHVNVQ